MKFLNKINFFCFSFNLIFPVLNSLLRLLSEKFQICSTTLVAPVSYHFHEDLKRGLNDMFNLAKLFVHRFFQPKTCRTMGTKLKDLASDNDFFVWIDLEMTGLNCEIHKIVEIGCILTDPHLNVLHEGLHLITHQSKYVFENECDQWAKAHHTKTGLLEASLNSQITTEEADVQVSNYIKEHTEYDVNEGKCFLAGNSVYIDKRFLEKYMPKVDSLLHYRLIDVSTIKSLCSAWYPQKFRNLPQKKYEHRALSDIKESIIELKRYKENFFLACDNK